MKKVLFVPPSIGQETHLANLLGLSSSFGFLPAPAIEEGAKTVGERRGVRVRFKLVRCVAKNVDDSMTTISVPRKVADDREVYATNCGRFPYVNTHTLIASESPSKLNLILYPEKPFAHGKGFVRLLSTLKHLID